MPIDNVHRLPDPEHRSRDPDAVSPRNPADAAVVVILPGGGLKEQVRDPRGTLSAFAVLKEVFFTPGRIAQA